MRILNRQVAKSERAVENIDDIKRKRQRKARARLWRVRQRRAIIGLFVCLFVGVAVLDVFFAAQKTALSDEVDKKTETLAQLDSENISLKAQKENSVDLSYIEKYAENVLGLVKMDRSREEYLELQKTDQVEVNEGSSGVARLVSSFVKSFSAILSFLR